jgi:hypothetical protein
MSAGADGRWDRIIGAADRLLEREAALAVAGSGSAILALRRQISPLLAHLARLAAEDGDSSRQAALGRLIERRRGNLTLMRSALDRLRCGLEARSEALRALARAEATYRSRPRPSGLLRGTA